MGRCIHKSQENEKGFHLDLIDDPEPGQNVPELTVSELAGGIKRTLEGTFGRVRVKGEIGRLSRPASGHLYFDLKDEKAVIASVAWKGVAARLRTPPEEGMEVVATGKITTFGPQSKYQLIVDNIAPAGVGALMVMLEKRKKALQAEGLFAPERKKPLPYLPEVIGVITSPSGAVIRDILHRLRDRFPRKVLLWPVVVQGEKCAGEVAAAIRGFNALQPGGPIPRPDLLIVARGGGSLEDLWGFNEELLVRAVADSDIPVISAVGHETDTTLIDFAADVRAPTPTAAAELAVPVRMDLLATLASFDERRLRGLNQGLTTRRDRFRDLARILPKPQAILGERAQAFDGLSMRLSGALTGRVRDQRVKMADRTARFSDRLLADYLGRRKERLSDRVSVMQPALLRRMRKSHEDFARSDRLSGARLHLNLARAKEGLGEKLGRFDRTVPVHLDRNRDRLAALGRMHGTLGYKETLQRGYAVVRDGAGAVLPDKKSAEAAGELDIEFRDGHLSTTSGASPRKPGKSSTAAKSGKDTDQGSLF